jgi:hypothetical protein
VKSINKNNSLSLETGLAGFCKVHFALAGLIIIQTIIYDAWKLIQPEAVLDRWFSASILLLVTGFIWYFVKTKSGNIIPYKVLLLAMMMTDLALASFSVYSTRGMASKAVLLFVIPIIISGILMSRSALIATAIVSIAVYSLTSVAYFVLNFNEGYKVELYGEVGFYSAMFLIIAALLSTILHPKR